MDDDDDDDGDDDGDEDYDDDDEKEKCLEEHHPCSSEIRSPLGKCMFMFKTGQGSPNGSSEPVVRRVAGNAIF